MKTELKTELAETFIAALNHTIRGRNAAVILASVDEEGEITSFDWTPAVHAGSADGIGVHTVNDAGSIGDGWEYDEDELLVDSKEQIDAMAECLDSWGTIREIEEVVEQEIADRQAAIEADDAGF